MDGENHEKHIKTLKWMIWGENHPYFWFNTHMDQTLGHYQNQHLHSMIHRSTGILIIDEIFFISATKKHKIALVSSNLDYHIRRP